MNREETDARGIRLPGVIRADEGDSKDPLLERALAPVARGRDVVVLTGFAQRQLPGFVAPAILDLAKAGKGPSALFLAADKKLTAAVLQSLRELAGPRPALVVELNAERAVRREAKELAERPDVVVAAPERLIDHIRRGHVPLAGVRRAVILESAAERLPEFRRDVQFIVSKLPRRRQTIVLAAGLSRESAASTYPLRRPFFIEPADLEPGPVPVDAKQDTLQERKRVSNSVAAGAASETRKGPSMPDEKAMAQALDAILKAIREQENPDELNRYRRVVKRNVPIFMRSYVAAYLFKKSLDGFVAKPADTTTLFVGIGKNRRVFAKDLIKLFMNRLSIERSRIGEVKVLDSYSFIDISLDHAQEAISKLSGINFRGRRLTVNLARKKGEGKDGRE
jgi:hypothetical protein